MQAGACFERAGNRTGEGNFEPVKHPGDSERDNDEGMKSSPWQPVEAGRDIGFSNLVPLVVHGWPLRSRPRRSHPLTSNGQPSYPAL
jgi:hypothetical protein